MPHLPTSFLTEIAAKYKGEAASASSPLSLLNWVEAIIPRTILDTFLIRTPIQYIIYGYNASAVSVCVITIIINNWRCWWFRFALSLILISTLFGLAFRFALFGLRSRRSGSRGDRSGVLRGAGIG